MKRVGRARRGPRPAPAPLRAAHVPDPAVAYSATVPVMQVTVPPPTQIVPSSSRVTWTRPARPSAVPWLRDVGRARAAAVEQPLRDRGVQAPGHRVLDRRAVLREERAQLEGLRRASGYGPTAPTSRSTNPGRSASTASASASSTATQPGRCRPTTRRGSPRARSAARTRRARSATPRPGRRAAAAARRTRARPAVRRTGTSPDAHSWTITSSRRATPPRSSQAWQVPSVGCPANGSSDVGVKIRTR